MKKLNNPTENFVSRRINQRRVRRWVALLSALVLFLTVNTLKLEADTLERIATCGIEQHVHDESCYDASGALICGLAEHAHTDACFQQRPQRHDLTRVDGFMPLNAKVTLATPMPKLTSNSADGQDAVQAEADYYSDIPTEVGSGIEPPVDEIETELAGEDAAPAVEDAVPLEIAYEDQTEETVQQPEYVINGSAVLLSDILSALGMKVSGIQSAGELEGDTFAEDPVNFAVEATQNDYELRVLRDFDAAELGVVTADEVIVITLKNGIAPVEDSDDENPSENDDINIEETHTEETDEEAAADETVDEEAEDSADELTENADDEETGEASDEATVDETEEEAVETVEETETAAVVPEKQIALDFADYDCLADTTVYFYAPDRGAVLVNAEELAEADGVHLTVNAPVVLSMKADQGLAELEAALEEAPEDIDARIGENPVLFENGVLIISGDGELTVNGVTYTVTNLTLPARSVESDNITISTVDDQATLLGVTPAFEDNGEDEGDIYALFAARMDEHIVTATSEEIQIDAIEPAKGLLRSSAMMAAEDAAPEAEEAVADAEETAGTETTEAAVETRTLRVRVYDVSLIREGESVEPDAPIHVETTFDAPLEGENFQLYHIVDGKPEEVDGFVKTDDQGRAIGMSFDTASLSPFAVVYYTVDFEYTDPETGETIAWKWPGEGSYAVADIMAEIGVEGEISSVSLERTEDLGGAENVLYLEEKEDGWYLTSEAAFQDTFELTVVVDEKTYVLVVTDVVGESTNLTDFLHVEDEDPPAVSLTINGQQVSADQSNPTPVRTGDSFSLNLHLREINGGVQFADGRQMTMTLPAALSGFGDSFTQNINVVLNDTDPSGNPYSVPAVVTINPSTNTMTLQWPEPAAGQDRTAFDLLKASGNAYVDITINGTIGENRDELVFTQEIKRYIEENPNNSLSLSKNGSYDKDSGRVNYTVRVDSVGNNNNVTVVDTIENQENTALVYDNNSNFRYTVYNKDGSVAKATTPFTVSGKTFEQNVGNLTNGQYAVIEYSAKVDTTKITGTGTVEQTGNKVSIKNNTDVPPVTHNLNNQIDWTSVSKSSTGVTGGTDTNNKVAHWQIVANAEQRGSMAGKTITDTIGYNSRNIMTYASGITVAWYDGNTKVGGETINFSDNNSRLTLTDRTDNKGQSWTYTVPTEHNGHNYKYVITYDTNVDVSGQLQSIQVTNEVETEGKKGQGQTNVEPGIDKVDLAKNVVPNGTVIQGHTIVTNQEYTSWVAEIEIPSTGLTSAVLEDYLPKTTINGNVYVDEYVPGTLLFGGDWNSGIDDYDFQDFSDDENNPRIRIDFKKKSDGTPGLAGTGSRRTIKVYYQTRNDPTWVETYLPGSNGAEYHINTAQIYVGDRSIQKQASVVPPYPTVKKAAQAYNSINIGGVNYPLYRYTVTLYGITKAQIEAGITITDTHDSRLVYHSARYNWDDELIVGETGYNNGSSNVYPTFSDVGTNMTITAGSSCFPLQQNGEPYSFYTLHYYMRGENPSELIADSMAAITSDGKPGKVEMRNDVEWDGHGDDVTVTYEYPGLDKQLIGINGRVAQFKLVLNPEGTMIGTSDTLKLEDDYENLSVDYSTIHWEPSSVNISYNFKGNKGTYIIPNGTAVTLYYNARILGDGNVNFKNTAKFGDWKDVVDEWRDIGVQASGGAENFKIRLYKYASDHMEIPLDQTTFKLLDENKQEMHPYKRDGDGNVVTQTIDGQEVPVYDTDELITFTTGDKGYVTVMLDSSRIGYALEKDKVYYLEETQAHPGYERDYIQYSFEISDSVEYDQKNGVYRYYNNDILKVSNETEQGGLIIVKTLRGINTDNLTAEEQEILDNIKFTIHGKFREEVVNPETGAVTYSDEPVEKYIVVHYKDFEDGRYRIAPELLVVGESYTVTESDAYIEGYQLVTTYRADGGSTTGTATDAHVEFTSEDIANTVSHRLSVNNEYSTHSYNFKKAEMGSLDPTFEDGPIYLRGAEFSSYEVGGDGTAKKVYKTDSLGEFGIRWIDHCYEYNKLYYVVETKAPDGYEMLPESKTGEYANYNGPLREKYYFYFSNPEVSPAWTPAAASVPAGKTAYDLSQGSQDEAPIENGKLEETTTQMEIRKDWKDLNAQGEAGNDIGADTIAAKHPEWVENGIPYRVYQVYRKDSEGGAYTSDELRNLAQQFLENPESVDCTLFTTEGTPDGEFKITYERGRTYPWYGQVDAEMPLSRTLYGNTTYYGYFVIDEAEGFEPRYDYNGTGFNTDLSHLHLYNTPEQTELHVKKKWIAPNAYSEFGLQFKVYRDPEEGETGDPDHNGWVLVATNPDTFELNKGNNWERTVSGLKKGYTYHIVETSVTNSEAPLQDWIQAFSGDNQFQGGESVELTNTYDGKALEVKKVWNVDSDEYKNYKVKVKVYRRVKGTVTWEPWKEPELNKDNGWAKFWKPGVDGFPAANDTTEYEYYLGDETVYDSNNQLVDMSQYKIVYSATADAPVENQGMMNVTNTKYDGEVTVNKTWLNVDGTETAKPGSSAEFVLQRSEGVQQGKNFTVSFYNRTETGEWKWTAETGSYYEVTGYIDNEISSKSITVGENSDVSFKFFDQGDGSLVEYSVNGTSMDTALTFGGTYTITGVNDDTTVRIVFSGNTYRNGSIQLSSTVDGSYVPGTYEDVPGTTITLPRDQNNGDWSYKWDDLPIRTPDGGEYFYTVRETKINGWAVEDSLAYESEYVTNNNDKQRAEDGPIVIRNREKPGSLKLKKLVTVGGQPTEGQLADGTYTFTLKKQVSTTDSGSGETTVTEEAAPAGKSPIVITITNGVMASATIGGAAATIGEDGYVEVSGLEKGTYVLYEADTTNGTTLSKLEEGYDRVLANRKITLNVLAGREGDAVRVAAKGTFTNNIETGTLELNKQIEGADADPEDEFTFEVSLTLPTGVHDGTFEAFIGSEKQPDITTTGGKTKVENIKLKGGHTYRISDLPIGTQYTIKETDANGYTSSIPAEGASGTITQQNSGVSLVQVTNTKSKPGALKLTKVVTVDDENPTDINNALTDGVYEFTVAGVTGTSTAGVNHTVKITFAGGVPTKYQIDSETEVSVADATTNSQAVVLKDLVSGDYTITETVPTNGMTLKTINGGKTGTSNVEARTVTVTVTADDNEPASDNAAAQVEFTNNIETQNFLVLKKWMSGGTTWNPEYDGGTIKYRLYKTDGTNKIQVDGSGKESTTGCEEVSKDDADWIISTAFEGTDKTVMEGLVNEHKIVTKIEGEETYYKVPYLKKYPVLPKLPVGWSYTAVECDTAGNPLRGSNANKPSDQYWDCAEFGGLALKNNLEDVTAKKTWDEPVVEGITYYHPDITFKLYRTEVNIEETDTIDNKALANRMEAAKLLAGNPKKADIFVGENLKAGYSYMGEAYDKVLHNGEGQVEWKDLPCVNLTTGKRYVYIVLEDKTAFDPYTYGGVTVNDNLWQFTNKLPKTDLYVKKLWYDADGVIDPGVKTALAAGLPEVTYEVYRRTYTDAQRTQYEEGKDVRVTLPSGKGTLKASDQEIINDLPKLAIIKAGESEPETVYFGYYVVEKTTGAFTTVYKVEDYDGSFNSEVSEPKQAVAAMDRADGNAALEIHNKLNVEFFKTWQLSDGTYSWPESTSIGVTISRKLGETEDDAFNLVYTIPKPSDDTSTVYVDGYDSLNDAEKAVAPALTVTQETEDSKIRYRFSLSGLPIGEMVDSEFKHYTYYISESTVPAGYSVYYTNSKGDSISEGTAAPQGGGIVNNSVQSFSLPSTGGPGTTGLYILGSILTLLAAVLLITKKRSDAAGID